MMPQEQTNISAVIIPVSSGNLILPKNIVAELMPINDNMYQSQGVNWINLHGKSIPLVSLSQFCPSFSSDEDATMALIVHAINKFDEYPLLAIKAKGAPHDVEVSTETLRDDHKQNEKRCSYVAYHTRVANLPCILIDLPAIEEAIVEMIQFHNSKSA